MTICAMFTGTLSLGLPAKLISPLHEVHSILPILVQSPAWSHANPDDVGTTKSGLEWYRYARERSHVVFAGERCLDVCAAHRAVEHKLGVQIWLIHLRHNEVTYPPAAFRHRFIQMAAVRSWGAWTWSAWRCMQGSMQGSGHAARSMSTLAYEEVISTPRQQAAGGHKQAHSGHHGHQHGQHRVQAHAGAQDQVNPMQARCWA